MSVAVPAKPIERVQFFNGQRLNAVDLQDLETFNRQMRWLHNQSLHQPGVASGYAVTGNKGDSEITVQPGYAIDSDGREIVLTKAKALQVPPVANDGHGQAAYYDLVVSYPEDADLKETETRDGVCVSRSAVRLSEAPTFCWVALAPTATPAGTAAALTEERNATIGALVADIESGRRIRLARAEVLNCQLNQPLSVAERRNARPALQPYIAAGNTRQLANNWTADVTSLGITVAVAVNTQSAGFRSAPSYFAHVVGSRTLQVTVGGAVRHLVIDGFIRIVPNPTQSAFTLTMLVPSILIDATSGELAEIAKQLPQAVKDWYVVWLGVEG